MNPLCIFTASKKAGLEPAIIFENRTYSFADLAKRCRPLCSFIASLPKDKPFAFVAHSTLTSALTMYAAFSCNRPFVPVHPKSNSDEMERITHHPGIGPFITTQTLEAQSHPRQDTETRKTTSKNKPSFDGSKPACVLFTSGSQGTPKGVVLTYNSLIESAHASQNNLGWQNDDRWLLSLPISHVGGLSILTRCLLANKCVILHQRFDEQQILAAISEHQATIISVVPTTLHRLLDADAKQLLRRLRVILLGGASIPTSLRMAWIQRQLNVFETYGMTETCSQVATSPHPPMDKKLAPQLHPLPGVKIEILNDAGEPLPNSQTGRICISGKLLMHGYINAPPCNGRFVSNDMGFLDPAGVLFVLGRTDDIIITGGENVHPQEIETVLCAIEGVVNAVVFGIPDDQYGQLVAATLFVNPSTFNRDALEFSLQQQLSSHQKPRKISIQNQNQLPLLPNGKIDRRAVVENPPLK